MAKKSKAERFGDDSQRVAAVAGMCGGGGWGAPVASSGPLRLSPSAYAGSRAAGASHRKAALKRMLRSSVVRIGKDQDIPEPSHVFILLLDECFDYGYVNSMFKRK